MRTGRRLAARPPRAGEVRSGCLIRVGELEGIEVPQFEGSQPSRLTPGTGNTSHGNNSSAEPEKCVQNGTLLNFNIDLYDISAGSSILVLSLHVRKLPAGRLPIRRNSIS